MPDRADSTNLHDGTVRLEKRAMYVDIVKTSQGLLWVGSMPDVSKIVDFDNPGGVHRCREEVGRIQKAVSCEPFAYHAAPKEDPPIAVAREGKTYRLL